MLKTRTTAIKKETRRALVVQQVGLRRKAVPNAKRVVRGRLVLGVKIACRGNTVRVTSMLLAAHNAPLDLVKVIQVKRRAQNAVLVNSTMRMVPSSVKHV